MFFTLSDPFNLPLTLVFISFLFILPQRVHLVAEAEEGEEEEGGEEVAEVCLRRVLFRSPHF